MGARSADKGGLSKLFNITLIRAVPQLDFDRHAGGSLREREMPRFEVPGILIHSIKDRLVRAKLAVVAVDFRVDAEEAFELAAGKL